jgi:hypothetical protein
MMADAPLLIIYQRTLLAVAFQCLRQVYVAGWLWSLLQAKTKNLSRWQNLNIKEPYLIG